MVHSLVWHKKSSTTQKHKLGYLEGISLEGKKKIICNGCRSFYLFIYVFTDNKVYFSFNAFKKDTAADKAFWIALNRKFFAIKEKNKNPEIKLAGYL